MMKLCRILKRNIYYYLRAIFIRGGIFCFSELNEYNNYSYAPYTKIENKHCK